MMLRKRGGARGTEENDVWILAYMPLSVCISVAMASKVSGSGMIFIDGVFSHYPSIWSKY